MTKFSINVRGEVYHYPTTQVMGIVNVTPDSFWEGSRMDRDEQRLRHRVREILAEGGTMIDVGAYSTRPGAAEVSEQEELERLAYALPIVRAELNACAPGSRPLVSADTFRARVAEVAVTELGADMINDISGGTIDAEMLTVVVRTGAPYILMHMRGTPQTMQQFTDYPEGVTTEVIRFFRSQTAKLRSVAEALRREVPTVILDPGYGFSKTLTQNYELFGALPALIEAFQQYPVLVGISRKSMIYKLLGTDASQALNGTTALNTIAAQQGAAILRVHDVREAVEAVRIVSLLSH